MPIDLDRIGNVLSRVLPFLAQEKAQREQVRLWLERTLQENAAREASQRRLNTEATQNAILERAAAALGDYWKDVPGGQYALPGYLKRVLPTVTGDIVASPEDAALGDAVTKNLTDIYGQFQAGQTISPDALRAVVGRIAGDIPMDIVTKAAANTLERNSQSLTGRGLDLEASSQDIRRAELAERKADKKPERNTTAEGVIKEAQNDRDVAIQKYGGVGQIFGLMPEAKRALKASIKNANTRIDAASKELGVETPIKTRDEMFKVGIAILSRFAQEGVLPDWFTLLYQGYDPDFVFGLQEALVKPDKKAAEPNKAGMEKAMALLQALAEGKVE